MTLRRALRAGPAGDGVLLYGAGVLDRLGREAVRAVPPGPCVLVSDRTVWRHYGSRASASLRAAGFEPRSVVLPPGEGTKTLASVARVLSALAAARADRETAVVALGGGVVTDLAGFAAAIYARGIPWIAVPTTLLGMADAAVGGKTGIDLPEGKNLAGAFHLARLVLADGETLATLPRRHLRNGLAEIAKMELLDGIRPGLRRLRRLAAIVTEGDRTDLARAAARAAFAKAALVEEDPLERKGRRILLNLGHTVGHALEAATGYDGSVLHGEAVSVGMVVAARVAEGRGLLRVGETEDLARALQALGLPVALPRGCTGREILEFSGVDKKRAGGSMRMVLPRSGGRPVVVPVGLEEWGNAL